MSEDPLLTALGRVAAEQGRERETWEKSAAPVAEASIDRLTGLVLAQRDREVVRPAVIPLHKRRLAWAGFAALPLAAAAAFALLATRARPDDLPSYTLSVSGGVREERGLETRASEPIAVAPRSQIVLLARPDARVSGDVHTSTFVLRSGAALPVPSTSEASDKGAIRVTVLGEDLTKAVGAGGLYDLVLVVGRSTDVDRGALTKDDTKHGDWIRFTVPVRIMGTDH